MWVIHTGIYDDTIKSLVGKDPQVLITFLMKGAVYLGDVEQELKVRTVHADALYYVWWHDQKMVMHIEFQVGKALKMPRRIWEYNTQTNIVTGLPVYSAVLYLVPLSTIPESVYQRDLPDGQGVHAFVFRQIKLWEVPADTFEQPDLENLLPLLPLTKDGHNYHMVERMIRDLQAAGKQELVWLGEAFAGLILTSNADKQWIKERFHPMIHEILKESWVYQEAVQETRQEVKAGAIVRFVELRFPTLLAQAKEVLARSTTIEQLQVTLDKLYLANTLEEAEAALR